MPHRTRILDAPLWRQARCPASEAFRHSWLGDRSPGGSLQWCLLAWGLVLCALWDQVAKDHAFPHVQLAGNHVSRIPLLILGPDPLVGGQAPGTPCWACTTASSGLSEGG